MLSKRSIGQIFVTAVLALILCPGVALAGEMIVDVPTPSLDIPEVIKSIKGGGDDKEIARLAPKYHRAATGVMKRLFHLLPEPKEPPYLYQGDEYNLRVWINRRDCGAVKRVRGYYAKPGYATQANESNTIMAYPSSARASAWSGRRPPVGSVTPGEHPTRDRACSHATSAMSALSGS